MSVDEAVRELKGFGVAASTAADNVKALAEAFLQADAEERLAGPSGYSLAILHGLNRKGCHVYGGTVPAAVVARRRAANRRARAARRITRRSNA